LSDRRIARGGKKAGPNRLADKHVARLVKRAALAAGVRGTFRKRRRKIGALELSPVQDW
jgi:hypothetical protein